jgi:hypothetical protein
MKPFAFQKLLALMLCCLLPGVTVAANSEVGHWVKYSGGSLTAVESGDDMKLFLDADKIRLSHKKDPETVILTSSVTEVNYGQEVHRRIGTAAGLAIVSFGIGALVAFSKSKKHYIGIVWDDGNGKKGGIALQADKDEISGVAGRLGGDHRQEGRGHRTSACASH